VITYQQLCSALSRVSPVSSPDSARQPAGVLQLALLLSLLNNPHAAIGLGSEEAERGKKENAGHFLIIFHRGIRFKQDQRRGYKPWANN
jgi:hypothetical protein